MNLKPNPRVYYLRGNCFAYTFDEEQVRQWVGSRLRGRVLNLFAGLHTFDDFPIQEFRVDSNSVMPSLDFCGTAEEFLTTNPDERFDSVIWDPPWNLRKSKEFYGGRYIGQFTRLKNRTSEILTPKGRIITAGYEITNFGAKRGFDLRSICVVDPCGEIRPYFLSLEVKK